MGCLESFAWECAEIGHRSKPDQRAQGGNLLFREAQGPTRDAESEEWRVELIQLQQLTSRARIQYGDASKLPKNEKVFVPANDQIYRHGYGAG